MDQTKFVYPENEYAKSYTMKKKLIFYNGINS